MHLTHQVGEISISHELWTDHILINNYGYEYTLKYDTTVEQAVETMAESYGFDPSECLDLCECIKYVQDHYKNAELT